MNHERWYNNFIKRETMLNNKSILITGQYWIHWCLLTRRLLFWKYYYCGWPMLSSKQLRRFWTSLNPCTHWCHRNAPFSCGATPTRDFRIFLFTFHMHTLSLVSLLISKIRLAMGKTKTWRRHALFPFHFKMINSTWTPIHTGETINVFFVHVDLTNPLL